MMNSLKCNIISICALKNCNWDKIYYGIYNIIALNNKKDANEKLLFHGTKKEGAAGILEGNFENAFFAVGKWGRGAYFADNPVMSNEYTFPDDKGIRYMFINKVILGKQQPFKVTDHNLVAPSIGFDSVYGDAY